MQYKIDDLKKELSQLQSRKTELATMCRLDQVAEIRARIRTIREKLEQVTPSGNMLNAS